MIRRLRPLLARLLGEQRATAVTEFALAAPLFLLVLMGIFDFGMQLYAKSVLSGAVNRAARDAALEGNNASQVAIDAAVTANVRTVFQDAALTYTRKSYDDFSGVSKPEPLVDGNGNGTRDPGECFTDTNGTGSWDTDRGNSGQGGGDEVVLYSAEMQLTRLFPAWKMLGQPQVATIRATTVLRNQPFNTNSVISTEICT
jgi:Flp pilus assembly protein TadG